MISRRIIDLTRVYNNNHKRRTVQKKIYFFHRIKISQYQNYEDIVHRLSFGKEGGGKRVLFTRNLGLTKLQTEIFNDP